MTNKKKVNVTIDGRNFTVIGDSSEDYIKKLADYVDKKIKEMTQKNDKLSSSMAATLACLNISDELYKLKRELETLKKKAKDPLENYENLIKELNMERAKNEELNKKIETYKDEILDAKRQNEQLNNEIEILNKALEMKEEELNESQKLIKKLQDKVFENQLELLEVKKELEEVIKTYDSEKTYLARRKLISDN